MLVAKCNNSSSSSQGNGNDTIIQTNSSNKIVWIECDSLSGQIFRHDGCVARGDEAARFVFGRPFRRWDRNVKYNISKGTLGRINDGQLPGINLVVSNSLMHNKNESSNNPIIFSSAVLSVIRYHYGRSLVSVVPIIP